MFQKNILLKNHSNYKIGGSAKYFFEAKNTDEIVKAIEKWRLLAPSKIRKENFGSGVFILGAGTNILFNDEEFGGLIIKIKNLKISASITKVDAGVSLNGLVEKAADAGLSGLEWAAGIPGTIGGAIRGNAGAFGGEMKDIIKEVISLDISGSRPKIIKRSNQDCKFNYRSSIFKKQSEIIIEASFFLKKGDKKSIETIIKQNINYRKERQPMEYPSLGSTFKNIDAGKIAKNKYKSFESIIKIDPFPVIPAAYLISEVGIKGVSCGGAMISPKHPNFIVNVMAATSSDVKNLIALSKNRVYNKFKIKLEEEIEIL